MAALGSGDLANAEQDSVPAYSWYALGVLSLVYMVNFVDRQILSILANDIKADLGLTDAQLGFLYGTAFAVFYALFGIPLGRLADGWHRVRLLSLGLALWSCMTALSGLARNGVSLSFARVGVGIGEATANPSAYSLIADWFPQRLRATALAIYSAGLFVGSGLSLVLGGLIAESWNAAYPSGGPAGLVGWQAAFLAVGLPGVALAVWVWSLREPDRGQQEGLGNQGAAESKYGAWGQFGIELLRIVPPFTIVGAAQRGAKALAINLFAIAVLAAVGWLCTQAFGNAEQFLLVGTAIYAVFSWACSLRVIDPATFRLTWQSPAFMAIVLAYGAVSYVGYSVTYWAAPFAERELGLSKTSLGLLLGAPAALGGFLGVIGGGWLADRLRQNIQSGRLLVVLIALIAPAPLILVGYSSQDPTTFLICSFLLQMATSSALGASAAATQALVLPRMRGTATAIFLLGATLIGLAFGPFSVGLVSEMTGDLGTGVTATLAITPLGLIALFIAIRLSPASEADKLARAQAAGEERLSQA